MGDGVHTVPVVRANPRRTGGGTTKRVDEPKDTKRGPELHRSSTGALQHFDTEGLGSPSDGGRKRVGRRRTCTVRHGL